MLTVISPAKRLDMTPVDLGKATHPDFQDTFVDSLAFPDK